MGNACASNRRVSRQGFMECVVKEVEKQDGVVYVFCPAGKFSFQRRIDQATCSRLSKGDSVYCLFSATETLITSPRSLDTDVLAGHVTHPSLDYYLFQSSQGQVLVLPLSALKTSFEISGKAVDCVLVKSALEVRLKIGRYNPFAHFTVEESTEKRHLARYRSSITDYEENKVNNAQIQHLSDKYAAYRRIRKDGNALYRSIFVQFLEHLSRKTTQISELDRFISLVDSKLTYFAMLPDYQDYADRVSSVLHKVRSVKAMGQNEELAMLQWILQDTSVDMALVHYLRLLIANFTAMHYRTSRLKRFIISDIREVVKGILTFGQEADSLVKYVVPDLLGVVLIQQDVSIDCDDVFETYYAPVQVGKYPVLHVCKSSSATYHILYSFAAQEVDGYDFSTNSYDLMDLTEKQMRSGIQLYHEISPSDLYSIQT